MKHVYDSNNTKIIYHHCYKKQLYFTTFLQENIKNLKHKPRGIRKIISLNNSNQTTPNVITNKNKGMINISDNANGFNNHFTKVAIDIQFHIKFSKNDTLITSHQYILIYSL